MSNKPPTINMKVYPGEKLNVLFSCAPGIIRVCYPQVGDPYALVDDGQAEPRRIDFSRSQPMQEEIKRVK